MNVPLQRIEPTDLAAKAGYSQVMISRAGTMAFVAGQLPEDAQGQVVGVGDIAVQCEQVFVNLDACVRSVGAGWKDVVKFTLYMRDLGQIAAFRTVRDRYIHPGHQPACTSIEVARFHDDQFLIVLEAIIRVPDHE